MFTKNLYLSTSVRVNDKVNVGDVKLKKKVKNESNPSSGKLASAAAAGGDLSTKKPESTAGATAIGGWSRCSSAASPCH